MDIVAQFSLSDKKYFFNETAARKGLNPVIIEKDFWVCRVFKQLFPIEEFDGWLIFKGGTSLSKCFDLIQRFSEDIAVDFEKLGFVGDKEPHRRELAHTKRAVPRNEMMAACQDYLAREFTVVRKTRMERILGKGDWQQKINSNDSNIVEFEYPSSIEAKLDYIRPRVILELGMTSNNLLTSLLSNG